MVKHIILWQLKDELSAEEKKVIKAGMKESLEALVGKVEGLASSNAEVMLDTTLTDEAALKEYAVHPDHVAVADSKIRPFTKTRMCLDFEV